MIRYKSGIQPRWKSFDDEPFLRWVAEYPVKKITAVGPPVREDAFIVCELHQQLPDGSWRSAVVPYHWIQFGGVATLDFRPCGLVAVDSKYLKALQARDARTANLANTINHLVECECCSGHYYTPRGEHGYSAERHDASGAPRQEAPPDGPISVEGSPGS